MSRRLPATVVTALAAFSFGTQTASASLVDSLLGSCPAETLERPFMRWLDPLQYVEAPDGGLEAGGAGWTLRNGASVQEGNEPWYVGGAGDHRSLVLPTGASATTPAMCISVDRPVIRFFGRRTSTGLLAALHTLKVEVLYDAPGQELQLRTLGVLSLGTGWGPTPPMPVIANLLPNLSGERAAVAFRFTATSGSWRVDDLYIDPYAKH